MQKSIVKKIDDLGLCLGCGLCESVCGKDAVEMKLGLDGFIHPEVKHVIPEKEAIVKRICPSLNVVNDKPLTKEESIWGKMDNLWRGFTLDEEVRTKGSSGGIISGLAIFALENGLVDGVLQVGGDSSDYTRNTMRTTFSREEVLNCASSRYAPAYIFNNIIDLLEKDDKVYMFIGKPCDISAVVNLVTEYPQYRNRFKYTVSIICAGLPSFKGTEQLVKGFTNAEPVQNLVYRGNGWPGYFSFVDSNGSRFQKTYNDSWGKVLNRHLNTRCKLCADGIGLQADVAVGDAWETDGGYPDFSEKDGYSLVMCRTELGSSILKKAVESHYMSMVPLAIEKVKLMQPYQYNRRTRVVARLFALLLAKRVKLNYVNLGIYRNLKESKFALLLREFKGTLTRLIK